MPNLIGGANCLIYVNGVLSGRMMSMSWNSQTAVKEIRGLDFPLPFELAPGMISITGSLELFRSSGDGGAQGVGLIPQIPDINRSKYFSLLVLDRKSQKPIFYSSLCMATGESWSVKTKDYMTGSVSFTSIEFSNEYSNLGFG